MGNYFKEILSGMASLAVGMGITLRHMFQRPVTVDYPYRALPMAGQFRGHIELIADRDTGEPNCVVCMACQRACPSECIRVDGIKPEGAPRKVPTLYLLDFTTCSLCGLCVESCRFDALTFSREYNLASFRKEDYHMDMLQRLREGKGK